MNNVVNSKFVLALFTMMLILSLIFGATNYVDAATCFKKCNPDGERKCFVNHIMFQNIFI